MFRNGRVKGGGSVITREETLTFVSQDGQLLYFYTELYGSHSYFITFWPHKGSKIVYVTGPLHIFRSASSSISRPGKKRKKKTNKKFQIAITCSLLLLLEP